MRQLQLLCDGAALLHAGGVRTWGRDLTRALPEYAVQLVAYPEQAGFPLAAGARHPQVHTRPLGCPPPARHRPSTHTTRTFGAALEALLAGTRGDPACFLDGLLGLAELADQTALWPLFSGRSAEALLRAALPGDRRAARLARRWLRGLLAPALHPLPPSPAVLAVGAGASAAAGLAARHRQGARLLLVEHTVSLRERLLFLHATGGPAALKTLRAGFHEALARAAHGTAHAVVASCEAHRGWHLRLGATPDRLVVIPPAVAPTPQGLTVRPGGAAVGYLGRIDPLKHLEGLIRAFAQVRCRVPHAHLWLLGPVPPGNAAYARHLRQLIRRGGLAGAVTLGGPVPDVQAALHTLDVTVLPSVSEGVPYGLLEAMMTGQAIVAARVGGIPETLAEAGLLVPPQDPAALAQALETLLLAPGRRAALGQQARARALHAHHPRDFADRYRRLLAAEAA